MSKTTDKYANVFRKLLETSAPDTIINTKWDQGFTLLDGVAFLIHSITYKMVPASIRLLADKDASISMGLATRVDTGQADLWYDNVDHVLDSFVLASAESVVGTLANARHLDIKELKWMHDFTNEPQGGRLIAPTSLYLCLTSESCGASLKASMEIRYTRLKMTAQDYIELYESMHPMV